MRRGGRLLLLLGVLIAALAALVLYVVLVNSPANPNSAQVAAPTQEVRRRVVTALVDIRQNTVLSDTENLLSSAEIPESQFNANPNQYFENPADLQQKIALVAITANSPIRQADVTDAGLSLQIPVAQEGQPRTKAYTISVNNLSGVADQVRQGDFVDVLSSFTINILTFRPSFQNGQQTTTEQESPQTTTKTLLQNVQVLKVLKPAAPAEGTPTPGGASNGPPATDSSGQPSQGGQNGQNGGQTTPQGDTFTQGTWLLVLAVTDQQAEVLKFSTEQGNGLTLVLRGRGDTATETTNGATLDILARQFGLPVPSLFLPESININQITPVANNPAPAATPAP